MPNGMRWVGLDVHAHANAVAVFDDVTGEVMTRRVVGALLAGEPSPCERRAGGRRERRVAWRTEATSVREPRDRDHCGRRHTAAAIEMSSDSGLRLAALGSVPRGDRR